MPRCGLTELDRKKGKLCRSMQCDDCIDFKKRLKDGDVSLMEEEPTIANGSGGDVFMHDDLAIQMFLATLVESIGTYIDTHGSSRELSLTKTKLQESLMWFEKHLQEISVKKDLDKKQKIQ